MRYLLDTNIISELRKGSRCNPGVSSWFNNVSADQIFLSVLALGEIRKGIHRVRKRDPRKAVALELWLEKLKTDYEKSWLKIDHQIAECWGRLNAPDPLPAIDSLLAATALIHDLTLVSRNTRDLARTNARLLNPFT